MTQEEKAKRYDETLEQLRGLIEGTREDKCAIVEEDIIHIFPELKKSEDEKIRKELLEHCKNQAKPYIQTGNKCPQIQSWIDWLEKQGANSVSVTKANTSITNAEDVEQKPSLRERYDNIAKSEWFKKTHEGMSVSDEELKWTDEDEQYLLVCKNALHKYQWSDKWDADIISKWLEDKLKQRMEEQ